MCIMHISDFRMKIGIQKMKFGWDFLDKNLKSMFNLDDICSRETREHFKVIKAVTCYN